MKDLSLLAMIEVVKWGKNPKVSFSVTCIHFHMASASIHNSNTMINQVEAEVHTCTVGLLASSQLCPQLLSLERRTRLQAYIVVRKVRRSVAMHGNIMHQ